MKLWTGRFSKEVDRRVNDFNSSIRFDMRLVSQDIAGSRAHARMLGKCGIISIKEANDLIRALSELEDDIAAGKTRIRGDAEDIHTFIEAELTARLGDTGKKLHTARSRNDQVATDFKLYVRSETRAIRDMLLDFADTLISIAQKNTGTVMPGYTHLQRAQPVTFAHHLMAYVQMLTRDCGRLTDVYNRADDCPLGAGARPPAAPPRPGGAVPCPVRRRRSRRAGPRRSGAGPATAGPYHGFRGGVTSSGE